MKGVVTFLQIESHLTQLIDSTVLESQFHHIIDNFNNFHLKIDHVDFTQSRPQSGDTGPHVLDRGAPVQKSLT